MDLHIPGIPALPLPVTNNPVVLADVTNIVRYCRNAAKKRKIDPNVVSAELESRAIVRKFEVISQFAGAGAAPAWFGPAMTVALAPLHLSTARAFNSSAVQPNHALSAPVGLELAAFPVNLDGLVHLSLNHTAALEAAFDLVPGANATLRQRRQAIATYIGVRIPL